MTYSASEKSTFDGAPIEMYEFTRGSSRWRYTSDAEDIVLASSVYKAITMERGNLESSSEIGRANLKVEVPRDLDFVSQYLVYPPSEVCTLTLKRNHRGAPEDEAVVIWMGRLLNLDWRTTTVVLDCEPVYTSITRMGLRKQYSRTCSHVLYGEGCRLNNTVWQTDGSVLAILANHIQVGVAGTFPEDYFSGGYAEWDFEGRKEKKMILKHVDEDLDLAGWPTGLTGGANITLFPGCDHTLSTCKNKFNNTPNYGGFPFIPGKNPFGNVALW